MKVVDLIIKLVNTAEDEDTKIKFITKNNNGTEKNFIIKNLDLRDNEIMAELGEEE